MIKESLFVLKPDPEIERIAREACGAASRLGLTVVFIGSKILTPDEARELYWPLQDEPWFREFMTYLISGEVRAYWTTGEDAMSRTLNVKEQTRARFARDRQRNAIHAPKTENDFSHNILLLNRVLA